MQEIYISLFILIVLTFTVDQSGAIGCLSLNGDNPVKWWVVLTDGRTSTKKTPQRSSLQNGVYFDDKSTSEAGTPFTYPSPAPPGSDVVGKFKDLLDKHLKRDRNLNTAFYNKLPETDSLKGETKKKKICEILKQTKGVNNNWFHEVAHGSTAGYTNPYENTIYKEAHQKLLFSVDADEKSGYIITHSMRIPHLPIPMDNIASVIETAKSDPSQHAMCITLDATSIQSMKELLSDTNPWYVGSNSGCPIVPYKAPTTTCDDAWNAHVEAKFGKTQESSLTMMTKFLNLKDTFDVTKTSCLHKSASVKIGDFDAYGFLSRKRNGCNTKSKGSPTKKVKALLRFQFLADKCLVQRYFKDKCFISTSTKAFKEECGLVSKKQNSACSYHDVGIDPWFFISYLLKTPMIVGTDQVYIPSLIHKKYGVINMSKWKQKFSSTDKPSNNKRHEKFGISYGTPDLVCIGDSNRNVGQVHHAGAIYCIKNSNLYNFIKKKIGSINVNNAIYLDARKDAEKFKVGNTVDSMLVESSGSKSDYYIFGRNTGLNYNDEEDEDEEEDDYDDVEEEVEEDEDDEDEDMVDIEDDEDEDEDMDDVVVTPPSKKASPAASKRVGKKPMRSKRDACATVLTSLAKRKKKPLVKGRSGKK